MERRVGGTMRRQTGPDDISYCSTRCVNGNCKRNLIYYKPPSKYYSCCTFDEENKNDELHIKCKWKLL